MVAVLGLSTFVQNVVVQRLQSNVVDSQSEFSRATADIATEYTWYSQGTTGTEFGDQRPIAPLIGEEQSFENYRSDY